MALTKTITVELELTRTQFVGRKINLRRKELGLTMRDLSEYLTPAYMSDVKNGKRKIGYEKLYDLSEVLGVSMDWFLEGWAE